MGVKYRTRRESPDKGLMSLSAPTAGMGYDSPQILDHWFSAGRVCLLLHCVDGCYNYPVNITS